MWREFGDSDFPEFAAAPETTLVRLTVPKKKEPKLKVNKVVTTEFWSKSELREFLRVLSFYGAPVGESGTKVEK